MKRTLLALLVLAITSPVLAQEEPAHGAGGSGETMPGHPPVAAGHGGGAGSRTPFDAPPVATATPSAAVPPGTVRVIVSDVDGRPIEGATVLLGTMQQGGDRNRVSALTAADGTHRWDDLPTGTSQAYRVNVPFEGATYSSTPFQLPTDRGYDVRVVRLPVTHDDRTVLQLIGQTFVEVRDERLHVIQQAQLANMSQTPQTYVFPEGGLRVRLPEGFMAFQTQPVMTDQRVEQVADYGMRIQGSLPPGRVTLTWAYDLPITGRDMAVEFPVPFRTYIYRVITDAPPGMELEADGLPEVQSFEDSGRPLFGTEVQRRPGDAPFESFTLRFTNIPGPGPLRWIAVAAAVLIALGGAYGAARGGSPERVAKESRERRKQELLEEAAQLERELERGEIGPQYRQSRHDAIVRELAVLLHQEQRAS
ncbi:carboxypeptidase-like regulatory domain-containing protein [Sandaracinus amylolyticus]|uniref:Carboxypeptidase regulatory-like domain-containing protein n=1 Tax=Sandaracinus amylolyticus TaxID=927083 RepID=A0A0F6W996_9BACT|nr:carboxypeptidase-like regulatory domain-containing protein [Sandaracinus amylolyticus]AKF10655.1 hypothetical protein DB32_007804 [Sandaracinus amylolyticus]